MPAKNLTNDPPAALFRQPDDAGNTATITPRSG
jgi:hypothetical protein